MKIRSIAVDDEPLSLKILEKYAADVPQLELLATCPDAFAAMEVLRREPVELIFLDINMPKLSGISLMKSLDRPPLVVFTTAYPEYAVQGFELEAVDYLLKPFSLERFIKAVNRAADKILTQHLPADVRSGHWMIKADKKIYKVDFQEVLYLEAYGDYVKVFTKDKMLVTKERLSSLEAELPPADFLRIHRSFLLRIDAITFIEGNQVQVGEAKLPLTPAAKEELLLRLQRR